MLSAEEQQGAGLLNMSMMAINPALQDALQEHIEESQGHIERLDEIIKSSRTSLIGMGCPAIIGLLQEANYLVLRSHGDTRDAAIIRAARAVENLEIAYYSSAYHHAHELGKQVAAKLLHQILSQEREADRRLCVIAGHVDVEAKKQERRMAA